MAPIRTSSLWKVRGTLQGGLELAGASLLALMIPPARGAAAAQDESVGGLPAAY